MKRPLALLALLCTAALALAQPPRQHMQWQGVDREYMVYSPAGRPSADRLPVFAFLHGLGGDIGRYASYADFQAVADRYGWLVVMPQALPASVGFMGHDYDLGAMWNAGLTAALGDTLFAPADGVDDSGFLIALLDTLGLSYTLDADSIFFAGMSMGGFMTHRMAIEHADRLTAAAAVSGLIAYPLATASPACPISMLHIHGTDDNIVAYDGSSTPIPGLPTLWLGLGVDSTIGYWTAHNGCPTAPQIDTLPDRVDDGLRFVRHTYADGLQGTQVQLIEVIGGQHEWYMDEHRYDIDYIAEIHSFFTGAPVQYSGLQPVASVPALRFSPNPAAQSVGLDHSGEGRLVLTDAMGRTVAKYPLHDGHNQVDISHLPSGLYLARTSTGAAGRLLVR